MRLCSFFTARVGIHRLPKRPPPRQGLRREAKRVPPPAGAKSWWRRQRRQKGKISASLAKAHGRAGQVGQSFFFFPEIADTAVLAAAARARVRKTASACWQQRPPLCPHGGAAASPGAATARGARAVRREQGHRTPCRRSSSTWTWRMMWRPMSMK